MAKNSTSKSANKRVKVQNLPAEEKTLTAKEAKKVKGGVMSDVLVSSLKPPTPGSNYQTGGSSSGGEIPQIVGGVKTGGGSK